MTDLTTGALIVLGLAVACWAAWYTVRDRRFDDPLLYGLGALEVLVLAQLVAGLVALGVSDRDIESATYVGYLVTTVLILPLGVVWALAEKSRWGTAVLMVAALTVAALLLRSHQVWTAPGG